MDKSYIKITKEPYQNNSILYRIWFKKDEIYEFINLYSNEEVEIYDLNKYYSTTNRSAEHHCDRTRTLVEKNDKNYKIILTYVLNFVNESLLQIFYEIKKN